MEGRTSPSHDRRLNTVKLGIAALVLIGIVGLSYREWNQYRRGNADATRSRQIVAACDRVLSSLTDAETGQRGFLLTGENRYLEPYNRAVQVLPNEFVALKSLVAGRASDSQDIFRLSSLVDQKMTELRQTIELRRSQGTAAALTIVLDDQGRRTMDGIRALCAQIQRKESTAQSQVSNEEEAAAGMVLVVTTAGSLVLLFLFAAGLDPFLSADPRMKRQSWIIRYGAAILSVAVCVALRMALIPLMGPTAYPFVIFFPTVMFAAWFGGFRVGVFSIGLSSLAGAYQFAEPVGSFRLVNWQDQIGLLLFVLIGTGIALLSHAQRQAVERASRAASELERSAADARAQQDRLGGIIESAMDAIITVDEAQQVLVFNRTAEKIFRCSASEALNQPLEKFIPERFRQAHRGHFDQFGQSGTTSRSMTRPGVLSGLRADGEEFPLEASISQVEREGRKLFTVILRDITERKLAEKQLQRERERLSLALTAGRMGAFEMNVVDDVLWLSPESYSLFGTTLEDFTPRRESFIEFVYPRDRELLMQHIEGSIAMHEPINHEFRILRPDGKECWINCQAQVEYNEAGHALRYFGLFLDITSRKQSEQMLRMWDKLAAAARLSAAMAHEVNNPLGAVVNLIYLAKRAPGTSPTLVQLLAQAEDELERVAQAARQTLGFYRESNAPEQIDIPALIDSVLNLYSNKLALKNITVERAFGNCAPIHGVRGEVRQALSHVIANAIDAVSMDGTIVVGVRSISGSKDGAVEVDIADDGPGIAIEDLDRIFEPFFTTKNGTGTGLGLWVAKEIIERHGGSIAVSPQTDASEIRGATFAIRLPCASAVSTKKPVSNSTQPTTERESNAPASLA